MVGSHNIVLDKGFGDFLVFDKVPGGKKIIDAPTRIAFPCFETVGPPGVFDRIRVKMAESVNIAIRNDAIQPVPFNP